MGENNNMAYENAPDIAYKHNITVQNALAKINESGYIRKGYNFLFEETVRRWDYINSPEMTEMLLGIIIEFINRKKNGIGTTRLANFLVAQGKSMNNSMTAEHVAQLLEVAGIMIRGGNIVVEKIQERFNDTQLVLMTRKILYLDSQLYRIRRAFGEGSEPEILKVRAAFGLMPQGEQLRGT